MEYSIRKASDKDAHGIAKVHVETWQSHYRGQIDDAYLDKLSVEKRAERWKEKLKNQEPGTALFIAEDNGEILGFCGVGPAKDGKGANNTGELYAIYVAQDRQGKGIGSDLMKTGLDHLRKEGFKKAVLWVLRTNMPSIKFYESKGWEANGKEKTEKKDNVIFDEIGYSIEL
ncbi:MAG: GNAT family N-acetyltransferase [Candidatus Pacebacteria bacterium]|nr:GNAT family N-acetyltransferase [Candidatus Paceibacterota bacterium]